MTPFHFFMVDALTGIGIASFRDLYLCSVTVSASFRNVFTPLSCSVSIESCGRWPSTSTRVGVASLDFSSRGWLRLQLSFILVIFVLW